MNASDQSDDALTLEVVYQKGTLFFRPKGFWVYSAAKRAEETIQKALENKDHATTSFSQITLDLTHLDRLDTTGAWLLARLGQGYVGEAPGQVLKNPVFSIHGGSPAMQALLTSAREAQTKQSLKKDEMSGFLQAMDRLGRGVVGGLQAFWATLGFFGEFVIAFGRVLVKPGRVRWTSVVSLTEEIGLGALPIVVILSFFIGAVVAFMGASLLQSFGVSVFVVELVGFAVLREFAPLITMILLAGRSDSAFAAQIGAMRMRQEISALKVMGLDPFDVLVIPRALACLVSAPLLTFAAMIAGIAGGVLSTWATMDIDPFFFLVRFRDSIAPVHLWAGLAKTPVFALVVATIGCRQGLSVEGDVLSLGRKTTAAVVEAIFAVVIIDALFAVAYMEMGI